MSASSKCLQILLAIFNLAFLIFGIIVLTSGVSILMRADADSGAHGTGVGLLSIGATGVIIGVFGCIGGFLRSKMALILYCVLLICLIIVQIVLGSVSLSSTVDDGKIKEFSTAIWKGMDVNARNAYQEHYECCGYRTIIDGLPDLKCPIEGVLRPCANVLEEQVRYAVRGSSIFLFVSAIIEVIAVIISIILIVDNDRRKSYSPRY